MSKLLFPVKLGPFLGIVLGAVWGCGYRSVYAEGPGKLQLSVAAPKSRVAYLGASMGAVDGLREGLASSGAYSWSDGYPRVMLEVLRVDEQPVGIVRNQLGGPSARATRVSVTAHAWIVSAAHAGRERLTGDMRRSATYGHASGAARDSIEREKAIRTAARTVGRALSERLLGLPSATDDAL